MIRLVLTLGFVVAAITVFAQGLQSPTAVPVAIEPKARLTAWYETRALPFWIDQHNHAGKWEEMGPHTLLRGWGGLENSGRMTCLAIDPTDSRIVLAGAASGGIWRSEDGCHTWLPLTDFEPSLSYGAVAFDPFQKSTIYAGMGEPNNSLDSFHGAGLMRSLDDGRRWSLLASDVFLGQKFSRIVPDPKRPGVIFVATTRGVLRTADGGGTWVQLLSGNTTDLAINLSSPNEMLAAIGYSNGSPRNGLYRSQDGGETWHKLSRDLPFPGPSLGRLQFGSCQAFPQVVYAAMYGHQGGLLGMMKSTDFGQSWIKLPVAPNYAGDTAWYYNAVSVSRVNPNVLFLCGSSTYRSLDGGQSWIDCTRSYSGGNIHPDHHALTFDPNDPQTVYLCTDGGIFRSHDLGEDWESVSRGLGTVQFQSVDVHPTDANIAFGGTQDNGTNVFDGSLDWTNTFAGDGGITRVDPEDPSIVYTEYVNLAMLKSKDGGRSWEWGVTRGINLAEGALFYAPYNLDPENSKVLVAGTRRVYRSTDSAENWAPISPYLGARVSAITIAPNNSKVIYAGTSDGRLWVTPDTGGNWFEITKGLPRAYVGDICIDPKNARTLYVGINGWNGATVWRSDDAGGSWSEISDNLPPVPVHAIAIDPHDFSRVIIGTEVGVFVSDLGQGRWFRLGKGLPNAPVYSLVANLKTGYITVGTHGRGAWRLKFAPGS